MTFFCNTIREKSMFPVGKVKKTPDVQIHKMCSRSESEDGASLSAFLAPGHVMGGSRVLSCLQHRL
jgi:hypothetical protein